MERRRTDRVSVSIRAERISGNEKHSVSIENISESGIHMIIDHPEEYLDFLGALSYSQAL